MNRRNFLKLSSIAAVILPIEISTAKKPQDNNEDFGEQVLRRVEEFQIEKYGQPLASHPAMAGHPSVSYNFDLLLISVSQHWYCTPSKLRDMCLTDKVDMCAWYIALQQIELVEHWDARAKARKKRN